jgi:hypothetical protein
MYRIYIDTMMDCQVDVIGSMLNYQMDIDNIMDCQVHWLKKWKPWLMQAHGIEFYSQL